MSFSKKDMTKNLIAKNNNAEPMTDDLNIKSHLNASLELNSITASEELINKTLKAIRQQGTDEHETISPKETTEVHRSGSRKALWLKNTRIIAGAAAAVIVIAVGLNFVSSFGKYNSKDMSTAPILDESTANKTVNSASDNIPTVGEKQDMANGAVTFDADPSVAQEFAKEEGTEASESVAAGTSGDANSDNSTSTVADDADKTSDAGTGTGIPDTTQRMFSFAAVVPTVTQEPSDAGTADAQQSFTTTLSGGDDTDYLSFKDIFPATPEEIGALKITDNNSNEVITLTAPEDIQDFYTTMDQYMFTPDNQAPTTLNYTIEVSDVQSKALLFTMTIGDFVQVSSSALNTVSESIYNPVDLEALLKSFGKLYQ